MDIFEVLNKVPYILSVILKKFALWQKQNPINKQSQTDKNQEEKHEGKKGK